MYLLILAAGFGGGVLRGLVGFIKHQYSYKNVKFELSYFLGMMFLSGVIGVITATVINELGINPDITNVNGGAIALGHPLGCTGAKLTTQIVHEMKRRDSKFGMVTMCIGGGMGAAGIFENLD